MDAGVHVEAHSHMVMMMMTAVVAVMIVVVGLEDVEADDEGETSRSSLMP